jgi:hypothetical protein
LGRSGTGASEGNGIGTAETCDDGLPSDLDEHDRVIEVSTMEGLLKI